MQNLILNKPNVNGYVRCGEILKNGFNNPYILRCTQCKEIYLLLESFILHLYEGCEKLRRKKYLRDKRTINSDDDDVVNQPLEYEEPPVKLDQNNVEMVDPLIVVKNENDMDRSVIKKELDICEADANIETAELTSMNLTIQQKNCDNDGDGVADVVEIEMLPESQKGTEPEQINSKLTDTTTSFVCNFMKSDENLTVLIAALRDQPGLWNKTLPHFGNKLKRREYMIKIAEDLNMNHNIKINGSQVSSIVVHLYRKYQDDLHKAQQDKKELEKQSYVKPWYLTQLSFIEPHLENHSLEFLDTNISSLMSEQILHILEIYKNLPHLWNSHLIENHYKNKRHESIVEMLNRLESDMNLKINENILEQYLRKIHIHFSRDKRRLLKVKQSNTTDSNSTKTSCYFEQLKFLNDHVPPLICSVCGEDSISPLHFRMHTSTHDGTLPFTCSQCDKTFKHLYVYITHAKRHFEDINYICKECGKKFANYTNLRLHMRIHTGDKPYCCEMCGDSFRFMQALNTHRRRHEKRYLLTCKICSQGFYSKMSHDDHMNSHNNIRSHVCEICSKAFITKRALKLHKVIHEDVRNYACKLCGKTFKHQTGVRQHMKTHNIATNDERSMA